MLHLSDLCGSQLSHCSYSYLQNANHCSLAGSTEVTPSPRYTRKYSLNILKNGTILYLFKEKMNAYAA